MAFGSARDESRARHVIVASRAPPPNAPPRTGVLWAALTLLLLVALLTMHCYTTQSVAAAPELDVEISRSQGPGRVRKLLDRTKSLIGYSEGPSDCRDTRELCPDWAARGECSSNPGYMVMNCRKSCKACLPDPVADITRERTDVIVLTTSYEKIRIALKPEWAPHVVKKIISIADQNKCTDCYFYRSEMPPEQIPGEDRNTGPPYGLLQGHLGKNKIVAGKEDRKQGMPEVQAAMVCLIGGTSDFIIAVDDHPEWGKTHVVFGTVFLEDMPRVLNFVQNSQVHPETWGNTHVQVLNDRAPFDIKLQEQNEMLDISAEDVWSTEDW